MPNNEQAESKTAIVAAIFANVAIAITKFIAAFITGSSAMLSEGIHSLVDTGNGGLLLFGIHASQKPADLEHPFGHGKELYFWSLIVAIAIFAIGCATSIYEGVTHLIHPHEIGDPFWNYIVLAFAFIFEGTSWIFGWRAFRFAKGRRGIVEAIHKTKDPSIFMVFFEDSAALLGLLVAFVGVLFGRLFHTAYPDAVASIIIGLLLGVISFILAYESKGLLIGEGVDPETVTKLRAVVEADPGVAHVSRILTMHFGPHEVLLTLDLSFRNELSTVGVRTAVKRLREEVKKVSPDVTRIYFGSESFGDDEELSSH
ncbi:MAG TPA: cation diffusion facilitator family transporter [Pyrinomonadaceae bacterium]